MFRLSPIESLIFDNYLYCTPTISTIYSVCCLFFIKNYFGKKLSNPVFCVLIFSVFCLVIVQPALTVFDSLFERILRFDAGKWHELSWLYTKYIVRTQMFLHIPLAYFFALWLGKAIANLFSEENGHVDTIFKSVGFIILYLISFFVLLLWSYYRLGGL